MENGVQLQRRVHDENAGMPALNNKAPQQQGTGGLKPGPLSARKAFGNITNNAGPVDGGFGGAAAPKQRRAFGELSVNRPAQPQPDAGGGKPAPSGGRQPLGGPQQRVPDAAAAQQQQHAPGSRAQRYAAGGVERYAGKTWRELDEEAEDAEDARAAAVQQQLGARLANWRPGLLRVACDDDEDDSSLLAPEPRRPARGAAGRGRAPASPDPLAALAGDDLFANCGSSAADALPDLPPADGAAAATPERADGGGAPGARSPLGEPW